MTSTETHEARRHRYSVIHGSAIAVAFTSGTLALMALLVGSPLQFGVALALCGAGWIVTHFVEQLAEQELAQPKQAVCAADLVHGYVGFGALVRQHHTAHN